MRKKSPVTIISTVITLAAVAALGLSSCTSVEEDLPAPGEQTALTDPVMTDNVTQTIQTETETEPPTTTIVYAADGSVYEQDAKGSMVNADPEEYSIQRQDEPETYDTENVDIISETAVPDSDDDPEDPAVPAGGDMEEASGEITGITLTFYSVKLEVGETVMPIVTMFPEDAEDKSEIWVSDNTDVAEVDGKGNITAISPGECVVTVRSAASPEVSASVNVTVKTPVTEPTYIDGIIIANKTYALPRDYDPGVNPEAQSAFDEMQQAAADEGLNIYISSGYRSYDYQSGLYDRYVQKSGKAEADRYSARPGHSEHQTGLAFDLNTIDWDFEDTDEFDWVYEHCVEYGFIIRYPKGKEDITGYMYEPWHLRYLGKDTARKVYDSGLTLEEYLGITSVYDE